MAITGREQVDGVVTDSDGVNKRQPTLRDGTEPQTPGIESPRQSQLQPPPAGPWLQN